MESESASARYKVKNQQTNYYIFSDGTESNGDNVIGAHNNLNNIVRAVVIIIPYHRTDSAVRR